MEIWNDGAEIDVVGEMIVHFSLMSTRPRVSPLNLVTFDCELPERFEMEPLQSPLNPATFGWEARNGDESTCQ